MIKQQLILFLSLFVLASCNEKAGTSSSYNQEISILTTSGIEHPFHIELALTREQQMKGLMFRESMPKNAGMLFYFGNEAPRSFWMKNTLIPLDIMFLNKNGRIVHIHENARPHDLTSIPSNGGAAGVLEINGGLSKKLNIKPGDIVHHDLFKN